MNPAIVYEVPTWLSGSAIVLGIAFGSVLLQFVVHGFLPLSFRVRHHDSVAAIFSIIGVTYAVLLAFVAMLTWEGFNKARAATFAEAGAVLELHRLTGAMSSSAAASLRDGLDAYVHDVVEREFPAQAKGSIDVSGEQRLQALHVALRAPAASGDEAARAQFLTDLARLGDARQERLLATQATVPAIVWAVLLAGGGLMVTFSALLGASSSGLHLYMTAALGASGALVIVLIVALDNPFRSDFGISATAFSMQPSLMRPE